MASDALKIVTHEDVEQAKRPLGRAGSPSQGEAVDPSRLMDMLGDIDSLKREIQDRMRRIEAVKQAKSLLMEDALRTEALNKRLAEIGKVMSAVHSGFLVAENEFDGAEVHRMQSREPAETRQAPVLVVHEGVALAWPKVEEIAAPEVAVPAVAEAEVAAPELTVVEEVAVPVEGALPEAEPVAAEETQVAAIAEIPVAAPVELESPMEVSPAPELAAEPIEEVVAEPAIQLVEAAAAIEPEVAVELVETPEAGEQSLGRAGELVAEARRLLQESTTRLDLAVQREEQAAADLVETKETIATAFQTASEQVAEAERFWKLADEAAQEAKRQFDDSTAQLTLAVTKEQQSSADFHAAQEALTAAYQSACQRLETAEKYAKDGEGFAQETRKLLERMEAELAAARSGALTATEDLQSARQELTTAYQFASVAAQRRLDGAEFFRKTASWVVFSTAFAWMAAIWMAWVAFHRALPIAVPFAASCVILAAAVFARKRGAREVEEG